MPSAFTTESHGMLPAGSSPETHSSTQSRSRNRSVGRRAQPPWPPPHLLRHL